MHLPLRMDGMTIRDADGRVIVSAINPCTMAERRQIVKGVNALMKDPTNILKVAKSNPKPFWEA